VKESAGESQTAFDLKPASPANEAVTWSSRKTSLDEEAHVDILRALCIEILVTEPRGDRELRGSCEEDARNLVVRPGDPCDLGVALRFSPHLADPVVGKLVESFLCSRGIEEAEVLPSGHEGELRAKRHRPESSRDCGAQGCNPFEFNVPVNRDEEPLTIKALDSAGGEDSLHPSGRRGIHRGEEIEVDIIVSLQSIDLEPERWRSRDFSSVPSSDCM